MEKEDSQRGGYDCSFIKSPHEQLQTNCSICLCILCDPHIVDCCGYSFCHACIKVVQETNKPCPLCNRLFSTVIPDKRLHRTLKAMQVCCTHKNSGCDWRGELGDIKDHLNEHPSTENKMSGCGFIKLKCDYCDMRMERKQIVHHQLDECQRRPYSCDYCHNYQSSFEDLTINHWPVCPSRPIPCPNQCGTYPERQYLERHLSRECPDAVVKCAFHHVGCGVFVKREDMQNHLKEGVGTHLLLQSQFYQDQLSKLESKLTDCEFKIAHLEEENKKLKLNLAYQSNATSLDPKEGVTELEELKSLICIAPLQFTVHSISGLQQGKKWLSSPFYTHAQGYKMCLKVYPFGHSTSMGSDLSMYVCIMKGHYDDLLKWPFRGSVTVRLTDQKFNEDDIIHTIHFSKDVSENFSGRVRAKVSGGWGMLKFVALNELSPKYLQNDSLQIGVDAVKLFYD